MVELKDQPKEMQLVDSKVHQKAGVMVALMASHSVEWLVALKVVLMVDEKVVVMGQTKVEWLVNMKADLLVILMVDMMAA